MTVERSAPQGGTFAPQGSGGAGGGGVSPFLLPDSLRDATFWYEMQEATGQTRLDSTGNGNDAANAEGSVLAATGKRGNSASFDGDDRLTAPADPDVNVFSDPALGGTLSFWVYFPVGSATFTTLFYPNQGTNGTANYEIRRQTATDFLFNVRGPGVNHIFAGVVEGVWIHLVLWFDPSVPHLGAIVNGGAPILAASGAVAFDLPSPLHIGHANGAAGAGNLEGKIDQVGGWKRQLTVLEKSQLYNGGNGRIW